MARTWLAISSSGTAARSGACSITRHRLKAASAEVRARVTPKIGVVGFVDAGYVGATDFAGGDGDWHSGAGLGLRYDTGFGPIRLDVATPVGGDTGDGVQVYVGIGQSF